MPSLSPNSKLDQIFENLVRKIGYKIISNNCYKWFKNSIDLITKIDSNLSNIWKININIEPLVTWKKLKTLNSSSKSTSNIEGIEKHK